MLTGTIIDKERMLLFGQVVALAKVPRPAAGIGRLGKVAELHLQRVAIGRPHIGLKVGHRRLLHIKKVLLEMCHFTTMHVLNMETQSILSGGGEKHLGPGFGKDPSVTQLPTISNNVAVGGVEQSNGVAHTQLAVFGTKGGAGRNGPNRLVIGHPMHTADRKSTRLNSSHVRIS